MTALSKHRAHLLAKAMVHGFWFTAGPALLFLLGVVHASVFLVLWMAFWACAWGVVVGARS